MKNKLHTFGLLLACALAMGLQSCAVPAAVIRMEPEKNEQVHWDYGTAVLEKEADQMLARAMYTTNDKKYLVFNVEITNLGKEEILVSPKDFYLALPGGTRVPAIDPEIQLFSMEVQENRREANAKNAAIAMGVLAVAAVTAAVVSDVNDNAVSRNTENVAQSVTPNFVNTAIALDLAHSLGTAAWSIPMALEARRDFEMSNPNIPSTSERRLWSDYTLRKTTVGPNEKVKGRVIFPRQDAMREYLMMVPVEGTVFGFGFKQRIFFP
jgi:hypothetical protein